MNPLSLITGLSLRTWLIVGAITLAGGFVEYHRRDAVRDAEQVGTIIDQREAITVHETAREAIDGIGLDTDPDGLLRETNGLRDDESGVR